MTHSPPDIRLLVDAPEAIPLLAAALCAEWPEWYATPGGPSADNDLRARCRRTGLPLGVVAVVDGETVGTAALLAQSLESRHTLAPWLADLTPWLAGGYVLPAWRRRGIGAALCEAVAAIAWREGHGVLHTATSSADRLLLRLGWTEIDRVPPADDPIRVYRLARPS